MMCLEDRKLVLLHNEQMDAGEHAIPFDGNKLSSGVYLSSHHRQYIYKRKE